MSATNGAAGSGAVKHFLDLDTLPPDELRALMRLSHDLKSRRQEIAVEKPFAGKVLAMIFDQPSTRTRISFDVAMRQLGGETIMLTGAEMQLGRGETMADTAAVLSRYVDAVMVRMLDHAGLEEFARHSAVPVINGLTRRSHPCQIIADLMTVEERLGPLEDRTIAWVGDGNNVCATLAEAAPLAGYAMRIASPEGYALPDAAAARGGPSLTLGTDPVAAVRGADVVVTDTWTSMGDADEERRRAVFAPYRVDDALLAHAAPDAIFLHCLPAHRGEEVTDAVMDGPRSAVFDEAENRVHAQKAVLAYVFGLIG
jgi:ornithine carbamoyltransferase